MATTTRQEPHCVDDLLNRPRDSEEIAPLSDQQGGARWPVAIILVVVAVVLVAIGSVAIVRSMGDEDSGLLLTHLVKRGNMLVTITEEGNLESTNNTEIKCEVAGGTTILSIVEEGTLVKKGDELIRLDASAIQVEINTQKILFEKARSADILAKTEHTIAEITLQEYIEGTFRKELQLVQSNIAVAQRSLRNAQNSLTYGKRMFRKGYISRLQFEEKEYAVEHARLDLELQRTDEDVLKRFTRTKMVQELQSQLEAAKAKVLSEKASLDLEQARLKRLEAQKEKCLILATADGMVIYARKNRWSQEPEVAEGVAVREHQTLIQLPDLTEMQVKVEVHESKVEQLKVGMKARIRIQDKEFQGSVASIANQAIPSGWWQGNIKKYATVVKIHGQPGLKPGMTAEVEIFAARHEDVLKVPVAAVVEQDGAFYGWVKKGEEHERRPLVIGPTNDQFVIVRDGLAEKDQLVLNPRAMIDEARDEPGRPKEEEDEEEKIGTAPADDTGKDDKTAVQKTEKQTADRSLSSG